MTANLSAFHRKTSIRHLLFEIRKKSGEHFECFSIQARISYKGRMHCKKAICFIVVFEFKSNQYIVSFM